MKPEKKRKFFVHLAVCNHLLISVRYSLYPEKPDQKVVRLYPCIRLNNDCFAFSKKETALFRDEIRIFVC